MRIPPIQSYPSSPKRAALCTSSHLHFRSPTAPQSASASSPLALTSVEMIQEEPQGSRAEGAPVCCWIGGFSQVCGQRSVPGACALCQPWGHWGMAGENLHSADRQVRSNVCSYFGWKCVAEPMKRLPAQCVWPLRAWYRGKQHGLHSTTLLLWRGWEHCRLEDPQSDLQIWQISFWFGSQFYQINPIIQTYRVEFFWHIQLHAPVMRYNVCIRSWDGKI